MSQKYQTFLKISDGHNISDRPLPIGSCVKRMIQGSGIIKNTLLGSCKPFYDCVDHFAKNCMQIDSVVAVVW